MPEAGKERLRLAVARRLERRVRASGSVRGAALVLHAVGDAPGDGAYEIDPPFGVQHLDALVGYLAERYALVTAAELFPRARARAPGERIPVALTFDDDLPSHRDRAAPVLARHGARATAFLCAAEEPFWWQHLQAALDLGRVRPAYLPEVDGRIVADVLERRPFAIQRLARAMEELAPPQRDLVTARLACLGNVARQHLGLDGMRALLRDGWELGFHTRRHDVLPALDAEDLEVAVAEGRERFPGPAPRTFAYPHGKAGGREEAAVRRAGYEAAFTGAAGVLRDDTDPFLIPRLQPHPRSLSRFALELARTLAAPRP